MISGEEIAREFYLIETDCYDKKDSPSWENLNEASKQLRIEDVVGYFRASNI